MTVASKSEPVAALAKAKSALQGIASNTEKQIRSVALAFRELAGQADAILNLAAGIVGCVENESVRSILPRVQTLGAAAKKFIGDRLQATAGILETVGTEVKVLEQLTQVTAQQSDIALKTKALSVLTNVEVAHLGELGVGFEYLAHELAEFSKSLIEDAKALESRTDARKTSIEETKHTLSAELPRLREKLAVIEDDLGRRLAALDSSLAQLSTVPAQFKAGVEDIAGKIAGVVSAVQSHDITRQQSEHVEEAFVLISEKMREVGISETEMTQDFPQAYAGLTIQIYQLKSIKATVETWTTQIKSCMAGILRVSASEMLGIGPVVLQQERDVSSQLAHIELLERESQSYSAHIEHTLAGLSSLMQFITEHVQRSKSIRDRLRLLSFNSIIEASHLGTKADAVLAIAKTIKEISGEWAQITERSVRAMEEMQSLIDQTKHVMEAFSEASNEKLREAQAETSNGLDNLRQAAAFAASQSREMEAITGKMQAKGAEVGSIDDFLDASSGQLEMILSQLDGVKRELETDHPRVKLAYDEAEAERLYSAAYTTEMERDVLHAALRGGALPVAQLAMAGNSVELF
jgi:hypothetical protein